MSAALVAIAAIFLLVAAALPMTFVALYSYAQSRINQRSPFSHGGGTWAAVVTVGFLGCLGWTVLWLAQSREFDFKLAVVSCGIAGLAARMFKRAVVRQHSAN